LQSRIVELDFDDDGRDVGEMLFVETKSKLKSPINKLRRSSFYYSSFLNTTTSTHHSRLPSLKLPHFDGTYSNYKRFEGAFINLVHSDPFIPEIDKFNYLLNCLSGPALKVVRAYQVSDDNYSKAFDRLKEL